MNIYNTPPPRCPDCFRRPFALGWRSMKRAFTLGPLCRGMKSLLDEPRARIDLTSDHAWKGMR